MNRTQRDRRRSIVCTALAILLSMINLPSAEAESPSGPSNPKGSSGPKGGQTRWQTINLASHPSTPTASRGRMMGNNFPPGQAFRNPMVHESWVNGRPTAEPEVRRQDPRDPGIIYRPTHLCTRLTVPKGAKLSLYKADGIAIGPGATSTLAAMRTRARYAFSIDAGEDYRHAKFFGTIDVVRGPRFPADIDPKTAAIPIVFSDEDLIQLSRDRMIVKYIVLEDPELALDYPSTLDQPIRYDATFDRDAVERCKKLGKILIAVYLGNRIPNLEERAGITQQGTLLLSKSISVVDAKGKSRELPPEFIAAESFPNGSIQQVSFGCIGGACEKSPHASSPNSAGECSPEGSCQPMPGPGVDPTNLLNNDSTRNFEYLCDGGDRRPRVGWVAGGQVVNIDPEDTVAEYQTQYDGKRLTASNRVCLFAPRYVEVRVVQMLDGYDSALGYAAIIRDHKADAFVAESRGREQRVYQSPEIARRELRLKGIQGSQWTGDFYEVRVLAGYTQTLGWASMTGLIGPHEISDAVAPEILKRTEFAETLTLAQMPQAVAIVLGTGELVTRWAPHELRRVDVRPTNSLLVIEKSADRSAAQVGEEVTFVIRYINKGTQPITNISLVDSLVTRLEYVPESADSDRPAVFTTRVNDADSVELRWEVKDPLLPGQAGMVKFTCKIR
ncbi:DUF11 domain-containing protein [bacterium]|nr:DUF11 domain-containing protein [bacterium]